VRSRKPGDRCSRPQRWKDAVAELIELQAGYQDWLDSLPENLRDGATGEALAAMCALDLSELEGVEPPRGFGRDRRSIADASAYGAVSLSRLCRRKARQPAKGRAAAGLAVA